MDKKAKAEIKRNRRLKQKEDAEAGTSSDDDASANEVAEPTQEELDGLF